MTAPLLGRIASIEYTPRGPSVIVSSHMRASVAHTLLQSGGIGYADATGGLTSKRDGEARRVGRLRTVRCLG